MTGHGGCNNFNGSYELRPGGEIRVTPIGSGRRMCGAAVMELEDALLPALTEAEEISVSGDILVIGLPDGEIRWRRAGT